MLKLPSISVIVPVYNVESYIQDCLLSIFTQKYDGDIELIVVDDHGSDRSMEITESLICDYRGPIVIKKVVHESNLGLSTARNDGMKASSNEYVLFVDGDDTLCENALQILGSGVADNDMVAGRFLTSNDKFVCSCKAARSYTGAECFRAFLNEEYAITSWNKLYLRSFLIENQFRFKEGMLYEDILWSFQVASKARSVSLIDTPTYMYRIRDDSISHAVKGEREVLDKTRCLSSIVQYCESLGCLHEAKVQEFLIDLKDEFMWNMRFPIKNRYSLWKNFNGAFSPDSNAVPRSGDTDFKSKIKDSVSWLPSPVGYLIWLGIKASNGN